MFQPARAWASCGAQLAGPQRNFSCYSNWPPRHGARPLVGPQRAGALSSPQIGCVIGKWYGLFLLCSPQSAPLVACALPIGARKAARGWSPWAGARSVAAVESLDCEVDERSNKRARHCAATGWLALLQIEEIDSFTNLAGRRRRWAEEWQQLDCITAQSRRDQRQLSLAVARADATSQRGESAEMAPLFQPSLWRSLASCRGKGQLDYECRRRGSFAASFPSGRRPEFFARSSFKQIRSRIINLLKGSLSAQVAPADSNHLEHGPL